MILPKQKASVILAGLLLSIAATSLLQFVNQHERTIAAEATNLLAQERASVSAQEKYVTRLYDLSGRELNQFGGRFYRFSPNGQRLITESIPSQELLILLNRFNLFDVAGRKLLQFEAQRVEFSPNGERIFATSYFTTELYDAAGRRLTQLPGVIQAWVRFSPNGQHVVVFSDESIYVFDLSGRQIAQIQGKFDDIFGGFNAAGQRFTLVREGIPQTCDVLGIFGRTIAQLPGGCDGVNPNGQSFLMRTGTSDTLSLRLYNFSGREIAKFPVGFPMFNSDGQFLFISDFYGNPGYLYSLAEGEIARLQGSYGLFSPNNQRLITFSLSENLVNLYDLSGHEIARLPGSRAAFLPGSDKFITYLAGSNQNQSLSSPSDATINIDLSGSSIAGGETRLFDAAGRQLALLKGTPPLEEIFIFRQNSPPVTEKPFSFLSSDGERLITSDERNSYLYNASGEQIAQLPGVFIAFSPTGQHLITHSGNKVYLFDRLGKQLMEVEGEYGVFSPDGQRVAITSENTLP